MTIVQDGISALLNRHGTCEQPGCSRGVGTTLTHVTCGASSGSFTGGERSAVDGQGRARTCCCFSRSVVTLLTPLGELGSVRDADLEQRWGRDGQGSDHRPHCGHDMY